MVQRKLLVYRRDDRNELRSRSATTFSHDYFSFLIRDTIMADMATLSIKEQCQL
jgi:hypothetical protein